MTQKPWKEWNDAELVDEAQQGLRGQGAAVEMTRRLKDSNNRLTYVNVVLTLAALVVAIVQASGFAERRSEPRPRIAIICHSIRGPSGMTAKGGCGTMLTLSMTK
jgi:hypothetical protein